MTKRLLLTLIVLCLFVARSFAAGTLSGQVLDEKKQAVIGAIVLIDSNSALAAQTDFDGNYKIENIPAGPHKLVVRYLSYTTWTKDINIAEGANTADAGMVPEAKNMNEVTVKDVRKKATENAVMMEIRKSNSVVSGVSSAQIQKSQDRSAADVVKRIPGVTITDGRFINIRGLNERYNNVFLNDAGAPSSEADRRAFSFDAIPSGMIERIMIYKTPSPELPGDFAGGMVKIYTQAMPEKNSVSASYTTSFREGSTFKPFNSSAGSNTDALGFDNRSRSLPNGTPSYISKNDPNNAAITRSFKNTWGINQSMATPDQRATLSFQRVVKKEKFQFGNTTAISYSNTQSTYLVHRADYDSVGKNMDQADTVSTRTVNVGIMENMAIRFGGNQIELKLLLNQTGVSQTTLRSDTFNGSNDRFYAEYYQQRTTALAQLAGNHKFNDEASVYNWNLSYAYSSKSEPDFKRIKFSYNPNDSLYKAHIANVVDPVNGGGRFFSSLKEHVFSFNHGLKQKIRINDYAFELGAGNYIEYKQRNFAARTIGYTIKPGAQAQMLTQLPLGNMFNPPSDASAGYFKLDEITSPSDAYKAQNLQVATYLSLNFPIGTRVKLVAGLRHEYNRQSLQSHVNLDSVSPRIITNFFLPSLNTSVNINEKMLVRLAYGETVNRPEFREWSPFYFYDFQFSAGNYGSLFPTVFYPNGTTLKVATIHNVDLRYEWYPAAGDMVHVGGFFKYFNDPIQQVITPTGGSDSKAFTYLNGDHAYTAGAEIDMRKNLGFMMGSRAKNEMANFSLVFNAAYIYSKLYLPNLTSLNHTTQLQGQSPYIVNAGLYYQNDSIGLQASLLYNVTGPRIYAIGNEFYPNIGEMPKHSLDFSISYTIFKKLTFLVAVQDILGQASRLVLDIDRNGKFDTKHGLDKDIRNFTMGRYYSLGIRAKF
ncbi:MAG: TonB-dependent receptor [Bacteroidetes bacterium]|nr:TonB-dependent receptor [Bacteroidota bacterium]